MASDQELAMDQYREYSQGEVAKVAEIENEV